MIAGSLVNWEKERMFSHPVIRKAVDYLSRQDFAGMETGKYPIEGEDMFALLMEITTKPHADQPAEKHERFLDIHLLLEGDETIGWGIQSGQIEPTQPYDEENDYALFGEITGESHLRLTPGMYAVLLPEDIHRPGLCEASPSPVRKVVVKINKSLFEG